MASKWDNVHVVSQEMSENLKSGQLESGSEIEINVVIDESGLDNAIGVDYVEMLVDKNDNAKFHKSIPLKLVARDGNLYTFQLKHRVSYVGRIKTAMRMYPSNPLLPHRQDFCYVKWLD